MDLEWAARGWRGEHGWPRLTKARVALADLGDDPNVDDVNRRRLIVYFVEDPDVARGEPVHARGAPRDRIRRIGLIGQRDDGTARPREQILVLAADTGEVA